MLFISTSRDEGPVFVFVWALRSRSNKQNKQTNKTKKAFCSLWTATLKASLSAVMMMMMTDDDDDCRFVQRSVSMYKA